MIPANVVRLVKLGAELHVESGVGVAGGFSDAEFAKSGAKLAQDRTTMLSGADLILRVRKPQWAKSSG